MLAVVGALSWSAWAAASPGTPSSSPATFALSVVRVVIANDYADAWGMLVDVERASVPRGLYVACERQSPIPGRLARARVTGLRVTSLSVPGRPGPASGYAVTVETTIAVRGGDVVTTQMTIPIVLEAGRFAWILHADRYDAYRHGHCVGQAPPA